MNYAPIGIQILEPYAYSIYSTGQNINCYNPRNQCGRNIWFPEPKKIEIKNIINNSPCFDEIKDPKWDNGFQVINV